MRFKIFLWVRRMDPLVAGRVVFQAKAFALTPILLRADRALSEAAAAGWTDIGKRSVHAICAIGAFIGADHRF